MKLQYIKNFQDGSKKITYEMFVSAVQNSFLHMAFSKITYFFFNYSFKKIWCNADMLFEIQFKTLQQKTFYFEVKESQIVKTYFPYCRK